MDDNVKSPSPTSPPEYVPAKDIFWDVTCVPTGATFPNGAAELEAALKEGYEPFAVVVVPITQKANPLKGLTQPVVVAAEKVWMKRAMRRAAPPIA